MRDKIVVYDDKDKHSAELSPKSKDSRHLYARESMSRAVASFDGRFAELRSKPDTCDSNILGQLMTYFTKLGSKSTWLAKN